MYNKYGFFESIDFSYQRLKKDENQNIVKTYMAHHEALILLSINNLINTNIFQKRFMENPEAKASSVLLQERMPEKFIVTKEEKEKPEKPKYLDYENYSVVTINKKEEKIIRSNVISNGIYTVAINQNGEGFSKFNNIYVNRFKQTDDYNQGIFMYVKNINSKKILKVGQENDLTLFMPDQMHFEEKQDFIRTKLKITLDPEEAVEIRSLEIENIGNREETLEITTIFEPVLSTINQDYAHKAFNNLFLIYKYDDKRNILEIKRKKRTKAEKDIFLKIAYTTDSDVILDNEFEIDREKLDARGNLGIPESIKKSLPFSKRVGLVTDPMVALRKTIKLQGGEKKSINLVLSISEDENLAEKNLEKYKNIENIKRAYQISKAKAEAESRYLDVKQKEMELYQKILGYLIFDNPVRSRQIKKINIGQFNQSDFWKYGISGDLKIILVKIRDINDKDIIEQVLKMYEYFRSKNIQIDLVFLDEEKHSYQNYVREEINSEIENKHLGYLKNINGGIFLISKNELTKKDLDLFNFVSSFTVDTHFGDLSHLISDIEEEYIASVQNIPEEYVEEKEMDSINNAQIDFLKNEENKYFNEYGAFSPDGKEYLIKINKDSRIPTVWSNILANDNFGTLVTENMGGYTWYRNCRLNRLSGWSNSANLDIPSEIIYLEDIETAKKWSLGLNPMPDENNYNITYGFGYAKYIHECCGIIQELETFVPNKDPLKINILKLTNNTIKRKKIKSVYYIKPVLGEDEIKSNGNLKINYDESSNIVFAENLYESDFKSKIFVTSSEKIKSFTGDKNFFIGNKNLSNPEALKKIKLNNDSGLGRQNCIAIEIEIELDSMGSKEIILNFGASDNIIDRKKYCV